MGWGLVGLALWIWMIWAIVITEWTFGLGLEYYVIV